MDVLFTLVLRNFVPREIGKKTCDAKINAMAWQPGKQLTEPVVGLVPSLGVELFHENLRI